VIEAAERKLDKDRETLALLDATLRLFHPDADPNHITAIRPGGVASTSDPVNGSAFALRRCGMLVGR
jgi:hypothetical protein